MKKREILLSEPYSSRLRDYDHQIKRARDNSRLVLDLFFDTNEIEIPEGAAITFAPDFTKVYITAPGGNGKEASPNPQPKSQNPKPPPSPPPDRSVTEGKAPSPPDKKT